MIFNENFLIGVVGHSLTRGGSRVNWKTGVGSVHRDNSSGVGVGGKLPV